jgi:hypothetical protein
MVLREEIDLVLRATQTTVERHRKSRNFTALPQEIHVKLVRAQLAAKKVCLLVDEGRLLVAKREAENAYGIVGGVDSDVKDLMQRFRDPTKLEMWARWVESVVSQSHHKPALVVDKRRRLATLYEKGQAQTWFEIDIGRNGLRQKHREGDGATPEGVYKIIKKKGLRETRYHRALLLNYPTAADYSRFEESMRAGRIPADATVGASRSMGKEAAESIGRMDA